MCQLKWNTFYSYFFHFDMYNDFDPFQLNLSIQNNTNIFKSNKNIDFGTFFFCLILMCILTIQKKNAMTPFQNKTTATNKIGVALKRENANYSIV